MVIIMIDAKEYGKALFLLTEEERTTAAVAEELGAVREILRENPRYEKLLDTPALGKDEKLLLIDRAFSSLNENLVNLIKILCEKHSVYQLPKIAAAYAALYDEARGIERVEALTAIVMTPRQIEALTAKLSRLTGKTVIVRNTVHKVFFDLGKHLINVCSRHKAHSLIIFSESLQTPLMWKYHPY